jgi:hypothetical protein
MGMTDVRVRIANLADPRRSAEVDLVVDSGAIYSVVQAAVLQRIGVQPRKVETFRANAAPCAARSATSTTR